MSETSSIISSIIQAESEAIRKIPADSDFEKAVGLIHEAVHVKGGKLVTAGMGKAGQIALNIATTFSSTGTPSVFLHAAESSHGDLGILQKNDVLLLVSNSGKTAELMKMTELADQYLPGIKKIAITSHPDSPLGKVATVILATGNPPEVCPLGLTPTTSTTTMTVIGDILVVLMMKKINFTKEDYARRHHGGYLGRKARGEE